MGEEENVKAIDIGSEEFDSLVVRSDIPVLVDWWAVWCGPCRMIAPVMNQLAKEYAGKAAVVKVNCDNNTSLAMSYNITALPTVTLWHRGKEVSKLVGIRSINDYKKSIDELLG